MVRSFILVAIRRITANLRHTVMSVAGLSVGIAASLFIFLFINRENSFDNFHTRSQDIYRVNSDVTIGDDLTRFLNTPPALSPELPSRIAAIDKSTRMRYCMQTSLTRGEKTAYESRGYYADSVFLEIFDFPLVSGDAGTALDEPNSIVISETLALKYFESADVVGKQLLMDHETLLTITGVLKDVPPNSHLDFDYLISFTTYRVPDGYLSDLTSWSWVGFLTYVQLKPGADPQVVKAQIDRLYQEKIPYESVSYVAGVQPLREIYYNSLDLVDDLTSQMRYGNPALSNVLTIVAIMILLIVGFNFTNLSIVQSFNRSRELGVRKTLGATRNTLVIQLLGESVMLVWISLFFAVALLFTLAPVVSQYTGLAIDPRSLVEWPLFGYVILGATVFGFVSGLYPALFLSATKINEALKGVIKSKGKKGVVIRNALVSIQFVMSSALVVSSIIIYSQLDYLTSYNPGFDKENVLIVKVQQQDMSTHYSSLESVLELNPNVLGVTQSERIIGEPWPTNTILVEGKGEGDERRIMGTQTGADFIELLGIKLKEGRVFRPGNRSDSLHTIILNQKAVELLDLENPIGARVHYFSDDVPRTIIGVVEDFNFSSLRQEIMPMAFIMPFITNEYCYVKLKKGNLNDQIESVRQAWQDVAPAVPFDYQFMDDHLNNLYDSESKLSSMVSLFTALAVGLALIGLFSMISFNLQSRMKEVGIRKVYGAGEWSLMILLSRNFFLLVTISCLVSYLPVYPFMSNWLAQFAYKTDMSAAVFITSLVGVVSITMLVVGIQALQVIHLDLKRVLRSE